MDHTQRGREGQPPPSGVWHPLSSRHPSSSSSFSSVLPFILITGFLAASRQRANSLLCFCSPTAWQPEHLGTTVSCWQFFEATFLLGSLIVAPLYCGAVTALQQADSLARQGAKWDRSNKTQVMLSHSFSSISRSTGQRFFSLCYFIDTFNHFTTKRESSVKLQATGSTNSLKSTCSLWRWATVGLSHRAISQQTSWPRNIGHGGALRGHQPPADSFLVMFFFFFFIMCNHSDISDSH